MIIIMTMATLIYGTIFILSLILAFSKQRYLEIEAMVASEIFSGPLLAPALNSNINLFNDWLVFHNKFTGFILAILSLIDLRLYFLLYRVIV